MVIVFTKVMPVWPAVRSLNSGGSLFPRSQPDDERRRVNSGKRRLLRMRDHSRKTHSVGASWVSCHSVDRSSVALPKWRLIFAPGSVAAAMLRNNGILKTGHSVRAHRMDSPVGITV